MISLLRKKFSEILKNRKVKQNLIFLLFAIVLYKLSKIQNKSFKNIILEKKKKKCKPNKSKL